MDMLKCSTGSLWHWCSQLNSLLGCLNLPTVSHTLINRRLRETGKVIEEVANETLENALQEEAGTDGEAEVSVDAGWQKRGSGRSYDSLSGHCTMIGCKTGKVVGYAVRSKTCRFCENAERYGYDPKSHECKKNWCGSSKAMEPDMVVEMVRKVQEKGIKTVSLIGDEDAATISLVRAKVDRSIKKKSDRNHIRKTVSSLLYGLQKKNKSFSVRCIKYIMKLFSYMLSTYANDREGMIEGLQALCCHPFGDHSHCDKWCDKKSNPKKMYASLPFGKPLSDTIIQNDLREIFHSYIKHADKLSCLGSTQANESLNKTIASKAPKHFHLSGSANLNYRIAAGIAQKNAGQRYLIDVHRKIGISPGTFMMKLVTLRDLQARKRKAVATTYKAKRRRMLLKQKRNQNRATCEVKEGPSYSSNIELNDEARHGNIPEGVTITQEICCVPKDHTPVFFDLETTGLERNADIVQIAAKRGDETFSCYILPSKPISSRATDITGISIAHNSIFVRGQKVPSVCKKEGLQLFLNFLQGSSNNVLYAHNCKSFDSKVLINALASLHLLPVFFEKVCGFLDTYLLYKKNCPDLEKHSQPFLANHFLSANYNAHNAVDDVDILQQLCAVDRSFDMTSSYFSCQYALSVYCYSLNVSKNIHSLYPLLDNKIISKNIARKIAGSGLSMDNLILAFDRSGADGIRNVFSEEINKSVRVTRSTKIIDSVSKYISEKMVTESS